MTGSLAPTLAAALARALADPAWDAAGVRFVDRREDSRRLTWRQVAERALAVAGRLAALGVAPGEPVALIHPTGPGFFDAFFGTIAAGAVPVPLYPPVRLGRLGEYHARTAALIGVAGARLLLADRRIKRLLGETVERARPELGCRDLDELPAAEPLPEPARVDPAALALIQFSSGTTVEPKPVALSHRAVMAQVEVLSDCWRDTDELRHVCASWLPLYHDMGLIGCVIPCLARPTELVLLPPEAFVARPALWLRAISRYRATVSPAPNFAYGLCLTKVADDELEGVDLSSWVAALNGAEAVAPSVLRAFSDRFARRGLPPTAVTPVYGLSEAALAVTFSALDRPFATTCFDRERLARDRVARELDGGEGAETDGGGRRELEIASVGRPLPGFEVAIRDGGADADDPDDTGAPPAALPEPLPEGRVGRVWVRGPSLMDGYLGRPEATARVLVDGWLDTGDLGFLHRGELYLTGRAKDLVVLRGRNYAPEEIERCLAGVAGVRPGCAVAASWLDDTAGEPEPAVTQTESLTLFVEVARGATAAERRALPEACSRAVLAELGLQPDRVVLLAPGTLPRTSSGKLRRSETLRLWLAGTLEPPEPVNPLRLAGAMARSGLAFARARRAGDAGEGEQ
jgi:acyl-CoA synthetase (AMP-forming)/AMP-acid ligase II